MSGCLSSVIALKMLYNAIITSDLFLGLYENILQKKHRWIVFVLDHHGKHIVWGGHGFDNAYEEQQQKEIRYVINNISKRLMLVVGWENMDN